MLHVPEPPLPPPPEKASVLRVLTAAAATLGVVIGSFVLGTDQLDLRQAEMAATPSSLTIVASNEYPSLVTQAAAAYPALDGSILVEPHRVTTLQLEDVTSPFVQWRVVQSNSGDELAFESGPVCILKFPAVGSYEVSVTLSSTSAMLADISKKSHGSAESYQLTVTQKAMCRYVRREVRKLTDEDRENLLEAMVTMTSTMSHEGLRTFGARFRNYHYFTARHVDLSTAFGSDAMHDGMGFLLNHAALTAEFEMALQSVNPRLCVPYWDFTYDSYRVDKYYGGNYTKHFFANRMWTASWFGDVPRNAAPLTQGRLSAITIPKFEEMQFIDNRTFTSDAGPRVMSPFGFVRSPWNTNKDNRVLRGSDMCGASAFEFQGMPTCADHHQMIWDPALDSWYEFSWQVSYVPHGPVHLVLGGMHNCDQQTDALASLLSTTDIKRLRIGFFFFAKTGYMTGVTTCPKVCSSDTPQEMCYCSCSESHISEDTADKIWKQLSVDLFLNDEHGYSPSTKKAVIQSICDSRLIPGDASSASSPADVAFWPMHPTLERLWQWRKLVNPFKNEEWLNPVGNNESVFCINENCKGHHGDDLVAFSVPMIDQNDEYLVRDLGSLTLGELYTLMDPSKAEGMALPFVYDSFDWDHCMDMGFDMARAPVGDWNEGWSTELRQGATVITNIKKNSSVTSSKRH